MKKVTDMKNDRARAPGRHPDCPRLAVILMMMMMMMTKVVDLDDKTLGLKYKSKMVSFLRQNW